MVFLESPAGVGFSTSTDKDFYTTVGDEATAKDTLLFIVEYLKRYPQFAESPLFISGESYGGHYVPGATKAIVDYNNNAANVNKINIKGFLVGNAWTDAPLDNQGAVEFAHNHALNSDDTFAGIMDNCDFTSIGPLKGAADEDECNKFLDRSTTEMGNINIYDIYADQCLSSVNKDAMHLLSKLGDAHLHSNPTEDYEPCIEDYLQTYMNLPDV